MGKKKSATVTPDSPTTQPSTPSVHPVPRTPVYDPIKEKSKQAKKEEAAKAKREQAAEKRAEKLKAMTDKVDELTSKRYQTSLDHLSDLLIMAAREIRYGNISDTYLQDTDTAPLAEKIVHDVLGMKRDDARKLDNEPGNDNPYAFADQYDTLLSHVEEGLGEAVIEVRDGVFLEPIIRLSEEKLSTEGRKRK